MTTPQRTGNKAGAILVFLLPLLMIGCGSRKAAPVTVAAPGTPPSAGGKSIPPPPPPPPQGGVPAAR